METMENILLQSAVNFSVGGGLPNKNGKAVLSDVRILIRKVHAAKYKVCAAVDIIVTIFATAAFGWVLGVLVGGAAALLTVAIIKAFSGAGEIVFSAQISEIVYAEKLDSNMLTAMNLDEDSEAIEFRTKFGQSCVLVLSDNARLWLYTLKDAGAAI